MLTNYTWPLPGEDKLTSYAGMFGAVRKHDIHTGVDLRNFYLFIRKYFLWIKKKNNILQFTKLQIH